MANEHPYGRGVLQNVDDRTQISTGQNIITNNNYSSPLISTVAMQNQAAANMRMQQHYNIPQHMQQQSQIQLQQVRTTQPQQAVVMPQYDALIPPQANMSQGAGQSHVHMMQQPHQQQFVQQIHNVQQAHQSPNQALNALLQRNRTVQVLSPEKQNEYIQLHQRWLQIDMHQQANKSNPSLEIEQKLSSLHIEHPNAVYLQPQMQQVHQAQCIQQQQIRHQNPQATVHPGQQVQTQQMYNLQDFQVLQHLKQQELTTSPKDIVKSSMLSADAAEFVPRFGGNNSSSATPDTSESSVSASQQANYVHQATELYPDTVNLVPIQPEYSTHPVIIQVDNAVVQLSNNPSKYDAISRQLTSVLSWQVKNENLMREVITVIFEQGVGEPNFRFTGGKLCEHLVKNVQQQYNGLSFKSLLLKRCQEEYDCRHEYLRLKYVDRLMGFTFFIAEILIRLLLPSGHPQQRLKEALCSLLTLLLEVATNDSLKCVAQVLKMSGRYLELGGSEMVEEVIVKLRDIAMSTIPPHIQSVLMSVVEFRAANWGQSIDNKSEDGNTNAHDNKPSDGVNGASIPVLGTVFYGPGGEVDHIEEDPLDDYQSDGEEPKQQGSLGPQVHELDGEERDAYDEFLQNMQ